MRTKRRRLREIDASYDHQCPHCFRIFRGPHRGENPGARVAEYKGVPVSDTSGPIPECPHCRERLGREYDEQMTARHGPYWRKLIRIRGIRTGEE